EGVHIAKGVLYAATWSGLSITRDGGTSWEPPLRSLGGLYSSLYEFVWVNNGTIYVGVNVGLAVSVDDGATWVGYTSSDGLPSRGTKAATASATTLYIATQAGLGQAPL
ncbi:MAG: hypothetical protein JRH20_21145, partial [Deltaproteobacteria bacterium]|nr:hypothetical protein [Deltaproteobacteria bacterium]